jgi:zinc D-Ala-D-Ala dipeptidase
MSDPPEVPGPAASEPTIVECGEPLVDIGLTPALRVLPRAGGDHLRIRSAVVDRLITAQTLLPRGTHLLIIKGHGEPETGHDPDNPRLRCHTEHSTGAAVDVIVRQAHQATTDIDDLSGTDLLRLDRAARRALERAMSRAGFVNPPHAWWHWSFGDTYWSFRTGAPTARYGPVSRN